MQCELEPSNVDLFNIYADWLTKIREKQTLTTEGCLADEPENVLFGLRILYVDI